MANTNLFRGLRLGCAPMSRLPPGDTMDPIIIIIVELIAEFCM